MNIKPKKTPTHEDKWETPEPDLIQCLKVAREMVYNASTWGKVEPIIVSPGEYRYLQRKFGSTRVGSNPAG